MFGSNSYWVLVVAAVPMTLYVMFGYKTIFNREAQEEAAHHQHQDTHGEHHELHHESTHDEEHIKQQDIQIQSNPYLIESPQVMITPSKVIEANKITIETKCDA